MCLAKGLRVVAPVVVFIYNNTLLLYDQIQMENGLQFCTLRRELLGVHTQGMHLKIISGGLSCNVKP